MHFMKNFHEGVLLKAFPLLIITGLLLLLTVPNPLMVKEENKKQEPKVESQKTDSQTNSSEVQINEGDNSVKVDVNNKVQSAEDQTSQSNPGTCKVTINGETKVVPADQVNVNETGSGDKNISVDCETNTNSSSNQTTVKNKIDINTSSQ